MYRYFLSQWQSQAALDAHGKLDHVAELMAKPGEAGATMEVGKFKPLFRI